ncbi:translation initiation factor IF-2-like [Serinus canaria]|uniref:translation initiation factor IF-2-like n=1 Tax=Serinus canaria TaxID=9135 RepID=UPI0021CC99A6|nr:translation initiation factor IF-2-like [Serinus canaria]
MRGRLCSLSVHIPGRLDACFPQYRRAPPAPLLSRTTQLAPLRSPGLPRSPAADAGAQKNAGGVRGTGSQGCRHGGQLPSFFTGTETGSRPSGGLAAGCPRSLPQQGAPKTGSASPQLRPSPRLRHPPPGASTSPGLSPGRRRAGSPRTGPIWLGSPSGTASAREEPPPVHDGD